MVTKALTGGDGINLAPVDETPYTANRDAAIRGWQAEVAFQHRLTAWDRFKAVMRETFAGKLIYSVREQPARFDPEFMRKYRENWRNIESFAHSDEEVGQLRQATSGEDLERIKKRIVEARTRNRIIDGTSYATFIRVGSNLLTLVPLIALLGAVWTRSKSSKIVNT